VLIVPSSHPRWLQIMEHTADTGIRVRAPALPELFARAAWAMFSVITDPGNILLKIDRTVSLEAQDLSSLLVLWLSELNYLHIVHHQLFGAFEVQLDDAFRLHARVRGEAIDPSRHVLHTEIKAVTYHQLQVVQRPTHWAAQVLFDL
jgi:SHS2 domain-containing protein